jgi:tetratricopeptide (TPR) repeat protein
MKPHRGILRAWTCSGSALACLLAGTPAAGADPPSPGGDRFGDLVRQGDAADARFNPEQALPFYLSASHEQPRDPQLLLKIARAYSDSTIGLADPGESRLRLEKALRYAQRASELDPRSPVALLSQAICYGKLGGYGDTRKRVEYARLVKDYADRALAIDPGYAYAHHVLGQWEVEVAALGRTKRWLVALVFGGLPPASTQEGVLQLERAVQLEPGTAAHRLELGFAYLANGEPAKARQAFEAVIAMPRRELYDPECHRRAEQAIASL